MESIINEIIRKIKDKYENLFVSYEYDELENHYEIWYNDETLDSNESFQLFIGELIYDYLLPKKIFNVSFYYNYEKSKFIESETSVNKKNSVVFLNTKSAVMKATGYNANINKDADRDNFFCLAA